MVYVKSDAHYFEHVAVFPLFHERILQSFSPPEPLVFSVFEATKSVASFEQAAIFVSLGQCFCRPFLSLHSYF